MTAATLSYARSTGRPRRLALDPWVLGPVAALLLIGLVMVASASIGVSDRELGAPFFYFQRQLMFVGLGLGAAAFAVMIPTAVWEKYSMVLLAIAFALLCLVLAALVVAACITRLFPWVSTLVPFTESTVGP